MYASTAAASASVRLTASNAITRSVPSLMPPLISVTAFRMSPCIAAPSGAPGAAPVPIAAYLEQAGVAGQPVAPDRLTDITVTMPSPPGWRPYQNTNLAPGTPGCLHRISHSFEAGRTPSLRRPLSRHVP